jgi:hypothetical protein
MTIFIQLSLLLVELQFYNLKNDIGESNYVANDHPEIVKEPSEKLD